MNISWPSIKTARSSIKTVSEVSVKVSERLRNEFYGFCNCPKNKRNWVSKTQLLLSKYAKGLKKLLKCFGKNQFLVLSAILYQQNH